MPAKKDFEKAAPRSFAEQEKLDNEAVEHVLKSFGPHLLDLNGILNFGQPLFPAVTEYLDKSIALQTEYNSLSRRILFETLNDRHDAQKSLQQFIDLRNRITEAQNIGNTVHNDTRIYKKAGEQISYAYDELAEDNPSITGLQAVFEHTFRKLDDVFSLHAKGNAILWPLKDSLNNTINTLKAKTASPSAAKQTGPAF